MKTAFIVAAAAAVVAFLAAAFVLAYDPADEGGKDPSIPEPPVVPGPAEPDEPDAPEEPAIYKEQGYPEASQWPFFGGDVGSIGVTDSLAPVSGEEMALQWEVYDPMESASMSWKSPSSAICVGERCYYHRGSEGRLYCCDVSTGATIAKAACSSSSVYNMAIAYGDGKVFVCTSTGAATVMKAFDADSLEQLYVSEAVGGGEVQGPVTYHDGKVFFGTYSGGYACFSADDVDPFRGDEVARPLWILDADGWYNAVPAFFGSLAVLVQRGFEAGGAVAYIVDTYDGTVLDAMAFDMEYASSGAASYEGRVYIPLNRVIDRSAVDPDENTPEHLAIRSYAISDGRFDRDSERFWESDCEWGGTQCVPVLWNGSLYIGGGGKTLGTDEPFWILDVAEDGSMSVRERLGNLNTKSTASLTTGYATEENGYAVYIYLIEYGHVYQGEAADSSNGYADIFVLRDSRTEGTEVVAQLRPEPAQFAFQSFSISEDGHVLVRNDVALLCYGAGSAYGAADVDRAVGRFLAMAEEGHARYQDFQRIAQRYASLTDGQKAQVSRYGDLLDACSVLTVRGMGEDVEVRAPDGCLVCLPEVPAPAGKVLAGWSSGGKAWDPCSDRVSGDAVVEPVYADAATVTMDPCNGEGASSKAIAVGRALPYTNEPSREGYVFGGWFAGDEGYVPNETVVNGDVALEARWLKSSPIAFDTDGGSPVSSERWGVYGRPVGELPTTVRPGYAFAGWFHDGVRYGPDTVYSFQEGITLKARWTENGSGALSNGKGVEVSGRIAEGTAISVVKGNPHGSSVKAIDAACREDHGVPADCVLITLKGEGIGEGLSVRVSVELDAEDGEEMDVYLYLGGVQKVKGKVSGGRLSFDASGSPVTGGVQILFGLRSGTGILERV